MIRFLVSASGERGRENKREQLWQANVVQASGANDYHRAAAGATSLGTTMRTTIDNMATDIQEMETRKLTSPKTDLLKIFYNFCV